MVLSEVCLICLTPYVIFINIPAAGAAMNSERLLGNTEPDFTSSAFAYPHAAFQWQFADDAPPSGLGNLRRAG